jgi:hypothetical protein
MSLKKTLNQRIDQYIVENPKQSKEVGYYNKVASVFNIHPEKARKRWRMLELKKEVKQEVLDVITKVDSSTIEFDTEEVIRNHEDVIRICKIDTSKFDVTHTQITGSIDRTGKQVFRVKASLKAKKIDVSKEQQSELLLEEIKKASPKFQTKPTSVDVAPYVKVDVSKRTIREYAYELDLPDLHIGKLAWGKESGQDYDIKIATSRYREAVRELNSRVNPLTIEKYILPIGNDMINIDNKFNTTTAGTPQSSDSRFGKMFQTAKQLLIDTIDELSQLAPVEVIVVPGNHDSVAMFTLGEVISAWYHNNSRVSVTNTPAPRKYFQYGKNGLMYAHGDREKHNELGIIFATEQPKLWADTEFRICKVGHLHKSKKMQFVSVDEFQGFRVQIIPSLSENDAWHAEQGYNSKRAAKAFLYHREKGEVGEFTYYV